MVRFSLLFLVVVAVATPSQAAPPPTSEQVRSSAERSLGFVEKQGVAWLDNRKCIACHHGAWMLWSFNEAQRAGIAVDAKKLDALTSRVVTMYQSLRPDYVKNKSGWVESTYMLMSPYDAVAVDANTPDWRSIAAGIVVAGQQADGSWKYAGQGLDRPELENSEATTLWALLALPAGAKADPAEAASHEKALAWLKGIKPGPGHDSAALRLAIESRYGDPARAAQLKDELVSRQNSDGGWQWSEHRASDAFATGEAIYVLTLAGMKNDAPAIQKAWTFLLTTQLPDGSWLCLTRKPKGGTEISSYWGTAWATIGLSRSLHSPSATDSPQTSARP